MNINNLPILLEIALKDRVACQLLCWVSKVNFMQIIFYKKVSKINDYILRKIAWYNK